MYRLDVLRGIISEVTNAAKTSNPVTTDAQMASILRKKIKASQSALEEFKEANRTDLLERETKQKAFLQELLPNQMDKEAVVATIHGVLGNLRVQGENASQGTVMKALLGPGGALEREILDTSEVARLVKGLI